MEQGFAHARDCLGSDAYYMEVGDDFKDQTHRSCLSFPDSRGGRRWPQMADRNEATLGTPSHQFLRANPLLWNPQRW